MRYSISATVNYIGDRETDIDNSNCSNIDDIRTWIAKLLEQEQEATSFMVIIVPIKEPHENVI